MKLWTNCGTNSLTFFLRQKNPSTTTRTKSLQTWRFGQKFPKNKKRPWPQTKDRRSLVRLVWQSRSPGYFIDLLRYIGFRPTTSAGTFPTIRNTFFRDIKRFRLFVLWLYHICEPLKRISARNVPQQNPNFCTPFRTFRPWYGGRAALSVKSAQQFWEQKKKRQ